MFKCPAHPQHPADTCPECIAELTEWWGVPCSEHPQHAGATCPECIDALIEDLKSRSEKHGGVTCMDFADQSSASESSKATTGREFGQKKETGR